MFFQDTWYIQYRLPQKRKHLWVGWYVCCAGQKDQNWLFMYIDTWALQHRSCDFLRQTSRDPWILNNPCLNWQHWSSRYAILCTSLKKQKLTHDSQVDSKPIYDPRKSFYNVLKIVLYTWCFLVQVAGFLWWQREVQNGLSLRQKASFPVSFAFLEGLTYDTTYITQFLKWENILKTNQQVTVFGLVWLLLMQYFNHFIY